jgi:serine/threonine protein kinase
MSDLNLEDKGFINDLKIKITNQISQFVNEEDDETDLLYNDIDFDSFDFSNCNFKLTTQGKTYENFNVVHTCNEQYGIKILRCKSHNVIIKLYLWEFNNENDYDPCIVNDVSFYNENNDKLYDEAIKMIDKPFYNILWNNKNEAEIILGYVMEDGHSKYKIIRLISYNYERFYRNLRITALENYKWAGFVSDSKKLIKNFITLKKNHINHFDIKPENITKDFKFMDFGCYMNIHDFYCYLVQLYNGSVGCLSMGTLGYQAPELVLTKLFYPSLPHLENLEEIMYKIDLFSLGCSLMTMICGLSFFEDIIYMQDKTDSIAMFRLMFIIPYEQSENIKKYYYQYFDENGYFKLLIKQLKERINETKLLNLIEAMISINPHERPDLNVLEKKILF